MEDIKEKIPGAEIKDTEVFSFRFLIDTILDYYCEVTPDSDPSEKWKKGTEHEEKGCPEIPEDVDAMIKLAFKSQLKKFTK